MGINDFKTLWFRDKAYSMECPSIDRIDNNGHYSIDNCRYIEMAENRRAGMAIGGRSKSELKIKTARENIKNTRWHKIHNLQKQC